MTIYTLGYEGVNIEGFLRSLETYDIDMVIDVREFPLSRKAGFSKRSFCEHIQSIGLSYQHWNKLGCPKNVRDAYKIDSSWANYTKQFNRYLETQSEVLQELETLAKTKNCALVCFEADAQFCHRSLITKKLSVDYGLNFLHLKAIKTPIKKVMPDSNHRLAFA